MNNTDWKTIDTAPKDGSSVLLCSPGGRISVAFYADRAFIGQGWHVTVPCMGGWGNGTDTHIHWEEDQPTHWMPLPPPPAI